MSGKDTIKVMLADSHHIFRNGVAALIAKEEVADVIGDAESSDELLEKLKFLEPDIILLDAEIPAMKYRELIPILNTKYPHINVLIFSSLEDGNKIKQMLKRGAKGVLKKSASKEELIRAIRTVASGDTFICRQLSDLIFKSLNNNNNNKKRREVPLTNREIEVLKLVAQGLTNKQIGEKLHISPRTVDSHRRHIMEKLDLHNAVALSNYANRMGLLE